MFRPLSSWMFVPANRPHFVDKAAGSPVDCAILDLEDGVVRDEKAAARAAAAAALERNDFGPQRFVRTNAVTSEFFAADLDSIVRPGLVGLCLPKVEQVDTVVTVARRLDTLERNAGLVPGTVRIVPAIESARGLLAAPVIATCDPRVLGLMFGAEDFTLDIGITTDRTGAAAQMVFPRSAVVVACAAAAILSIDGVYPHLDDPAGLRADCLLARQLGFRAKSTFNPRQVDEINRAFHPSPEEIRFAEEVVAGFRAATARGDSSVVVGGQLVDLPIALRARRVLELAGAVVQ